MSTTPRTDAAMGSDSWSGVSASFARQLETELTAAKEKIAELERTRHEDNCIICWPTPDKDEKEPTVLWAEIWRLRAMVKGPTGHETWRDAAVSEKQKRFAAEAQIKALLQDAQRYKA